MAEMQAIDNELVNAMFAADIEEIARPTQREFLKPSQKMMFHEACFANDAAKKEWKMNVDFTPQGLKLLVIRTALANSTAYDADGTIPQASTTEIVDLSMARAAVLLHIVEVVKSQIEDEADEAEFGTFFTHEKEDITHFAKRTNDHEAVIDLKKLFDIQDCGITAVAFQGPVAGDATVIVLQRPQIYENRVVVPQSMKPSFGVAVSTMSIHLRTAMQLVILSLISLFKTGHHWMPETKEILSRLCGAIGLTLDLSSSPFWCRLIVHAVKLNVRVAMMARSHSESNLRQEVVIRCSGTGHGVAKLNLMWAILYWSRARGEREFELYLYELFLKCNRQEEYSQMMRDFKNQDRVHSSSAHFGVPNFNKCALNQFGFSSIDGETVVQNSGGASVAWYTNRRAQVLTLESLKGPILELIAVIADRIGESLCFGSAKNISGSQKDAVRQRLATLKGLMAEAPEEQKAIYTGQLLTKQEIDAPAEALRGILGM